MNHDGILKGVPYIYVLPAIKSDITMKVFISWSGKLSKELAEVLKNWIPKVIQAAKPFYSPHDISKGSRWNNDISKELDDTKVGLICLTQDNLESPWIMFEAGALSKNVDNSKVCPILFNLETSQIVGPLTQFQATTKFSKEEIYKTISMLNEELGELKLKSSDLDEQFEMWWPRLKENVEKILSNTQPVSKTEKRPTEDILEEILQLTRTISIANNRKERQPFHPRAVKDLTESFEDLLTISLELNNEILFRKLRKMVAPLEHLIKRAVMTTSDKEEVITRLYNSSNKMEIEISKQEVSIEYKSADNDKNE